MYKFLFLTLFLFKTPCFANNSCEILLKENAQIKVKLKVKQGGVVLSDSEIPITGESHYNLQLILKNLRITDEDMNHWAMAQKIVLSLAEGMSPLIPYLNARQIYARGLDIWYGENVEIPVLNKIGKQMSVYRKKNRELLIPGDIFDIPINDESVDVVLSHKLANNLNAADQARVIAESLRVLKVGGQLRFSQFSMLGLIDLENNLNFKTNPQSIKVSFDGSTIVIHKTAKTNFKFGGQPSLLILKNN